MVNESDFVTIATVQGQAIAKILEAHLQSEGIPVLLKYDSAAVVYGLTVDGLGQIKILVPKELAEEAKGIIEPQEFSPPE